MKKRIIAVLLLAVLCIALCACAEKVTMTAGTETLTYSGASLKDFYGDMYPSAEGYKVLAVAFDTGKAEPDLDAITAALFGDSPATIGTGTQDFTCAAIAFEESKSGNVTAVALFDVPESVKGSSAALSFGGQTAQIKL